MVRVMVCGGGGGTHVVAAMTSSRPGFDAIVLAMKGDKAKQWTEIMHENDLTVNVKSPNKKGQHCIRSKPSQVTDDPKVAEECDVIILCVPAFAHGQYLIALKEYVKPGTTLVGLPGQAGFEFEVRSYWGDLVDQCVVISYETLPWVSRLEEFGKTAVVMGTKEAIKGAAIMNAMPMTCTQANDIMQQIVGHHPRLIFTSHILCSSLNALNGYLHPVIVYGQWVGWDGETCPQKPEFYTGMTRQTAVILDRVSCEIVDVVQHISKQRPEADLQAVDHLYDIICRYYQQNILDKTDLYSVITTNQIYRDLHHPVIESSGGFLPDFSHRYLTEDIPYGLAVIRGIAEIARTPTPTIDTVLLWCQSKMNREYLVDGKMVGGDIGESRCPQKYGIHTLDDMLGF